MRDLACSVALQHRRERESRPFGRARFAYPIRKNARCRCAKPDRDPEKYIRSELFVFPVQEFVVSRRFVKIAPRGKRVEAGPSEERDAYRRRCACCQKRRQDPGALGWILFGLENARVLWRKGRRFWAWFFAFWFDEDHAARGACFDRLGLSEHRSLHATFEHVFAWAHV